MSQFMKSMKLVPPSRFISWKKKNFLASAGSAFYQIWLGQEPQHIIFGKFNFPLISENEFFHEIKVTERQVSWISWDVDVCWSPKRCHTMLWCHKVQLYPIVQVTNQNNEYYTPLFGTFLQINNHQNLMKPRCPINKLSITTKIQPQSYLFWSHEISHKPSS